MSLLGFEKAPKQQEYANRDACLAVFLFLVEPLRQVFTKIKFRSRKSAGNPRSTLSFNKQTRLPTVNRSVGL